MANFLNVHPIHDLLGRLSSTKMIHVFTEYIFFIFHFTHFYIYIIFFRVKGFSKGALYLKGGWKGTKNSLTPSLVVKEILTAKNNLSNSICQKRVIKLQVRYSLRTYI